MARRELLEFLGVISGIIISSTCISYIVIENNKERSIQLNNTELIKLSEVLKTEDRLDEVFTYGQTKDFSVFTSEIFKEKCLNSQPDNIKDNLQYIMKISSNQLLGRKHTVEQITSSSYQLIKLFPEKLNITQINCPSFTYNKIQQEFLYHNKPVRFLLNSSYKHFYNDYNLNK